MSPSPDVPQPLSPLEFPLSGSRLIEASAGTGKTFTIAMLYVRLVLGHGQSGPPGGIGTQPDLFEAASAATSAFSRALTPPEILVVTFTDAATQELHERIRARLTQAADYFRADPNRVAPQAAGHDLLHDLRADYPAPDWPAMAHRLTLAAEWMDEAAVSTIHSWCNRMLREHAFDSGSLFAQSLETDERELRDEVVRDYWRSFLAPLDAAAAADILDWKITGPAVLAEKLRGLLPHVGLLPNAAPPAQALLEHRAERGRRLAAFKQPWHDWLPALTELIDTARAKRQFDARKLNQRNAGHWLQAIAQWRDDPAQILPNLSDKAWERLSRAGLAEIWQDGSPPDHPALDALAHLGEAVAALPDAQDDLLRHAAHWVVERFAAEQARRAQMGFDDLIRRLQVALAGPNGTRLAAVIRQQFPIALIDEFQDTDPVQYAIFDAIYRIAANAPDTGLILIGDPKQAIYGFRGADIHTYLAARAATAGRHYTLRRNFRATHAMVAATNHCFTSAETRTTGAGAFRFRLGHDNPIPFVAAESQGRADCLLVDGATPPALTVWALASTVPDKPLGKGAYQIAIAEVCASEIVRLLTRGQAAQAGFAPTPADAISNPPLVAVRPADLAVLVNTRAEASIIRAALARRGVRSVYLSDQDCVFSSDQAGDLQHWLAACAEPDDGHRLRAALATPTLGLDWTSLDTLNRDERVWEDRVVQFRGYRDCWRRQGVLPMVRRLLNDFAVPARLLGESADQPPASPTAAPPDSGERVLTDLLHLAELLQQASTLLDGEHALIRHLAEQRLEATQGSLGSGDTRQVRLESDADLVQVITIHKSKGLEYPLVFLPFAASFRGTPQDQSPLKWHHAGRMHLSLAPTPEIVARVDHDRLAEDLRKLYVALTRARHATWIGLAPIKDFHQSALGYLLAGDEPIAPDAFLPRLQAWCSDCSAIALVTEPLATANRYASSSASRPAGRARQALRAIDSRWWIASYTAITAGLDNTPTPPETASQETFAEDPHPWPRPADPDTGQPLSGLAQSGLAQSGLAQSGPGVSGPGVPVPGATGLAPPRVPDSAGPLHTFPRGAETGIFLHDLLEWAATQGFARVASHPGLLRDQVARRCQVRGWAGWIEPLTAWLHHLLSTPLTLPAQHGMPATAVRLADLVGPIAELEFWLSAHRVSIAQVDRLVSQATLDRAPRPPLQPRQLEGLLKGFIDLVFEHEGRFYVLDYKSNWLGPDDSAYTAQAQRAVILQSRYELQYVLYLFALHRLLRSRLPDYDYDRHIGGAVYLFLRGTHAPDQGVHAERPPRELIESLDHLFAGSSAGEPA